MESKKKDALLELLKWSPAFVQLDARVDGVSLPEHLMGERGVVLQLGYDMPIPIYDLTIDDEGIRATLSFRRQPHRCVVPWKAVYVMTDGAEKRAVFPEDMPRDLIEQAPETAAQKSPVKRIPAQKVTAQKVTALKSREMKSTENTSTADPEPTPPEPKKPRPSHLKLVK